MPDKTIIQKIPVKRKEKKSLRWPEKGDELMGNMRLTMAALLDLGNFNESSREFYGGKKLEFGAFLRQFSHREIRRVISYCGEESPGSLAAFKYRVEKFGVEVKSKPIKTFADGTKKANLDLEIALDAVELAKRVEVILFLTGDTDFVALFRYLQSRAVRVELIAFEDLISRELVEAVDCFYPLTDDLLFAQVRKRNGQLV